MGPQEHMVMNRKLVKDKHTEWEQEDRVDNQR